MNIDSRGRIRFTEGGVRYEINKDGVLRSYVRDAHGKDTERRTRTERPTDGVNINSLGLDGSVAMLRAIRTHNRRVRAQQEPDMEQKLRVRLGHPCGLSHPEGAPTYIDDLDQKVLKQLLDAVERHAADAKLHPASVTIEIRKA